MSREIPSSILARNPRFVEIPQDIIDSAIANAEDSRNFYEAGRANYSIERENKLIEENLQSALRSFDKQRVKELIPSHILAYNPRFAELDYETVKMIETESHDSRHSYGLSGRPDIGWKVMETGLTRALDELDKQKLKEQKP